MTDTSMSILGTSSFLLSLLSPSLSISISLSISLSLSLSLSLYLSISLSISTSLTHLKQKHRKGHGIRPISLDFESVGL